MARAQVMATAKKKGGLALARLAGERESTARIIKAIRAVPKGKVSCYRDIALAAGLPNGARQVVWVLHSMSEKHRLPWHRIIRADGSIALREGEGGDLQAKLLRAEGVAVTKTGRVDMRRYAR